MKNKYYPLKKWKQVYIKNPKCIQCGIPDYLNSDKICLNCYTLAVEREYFRLLKEKKGDGKCL